jgi:hypothetical protein
MPDSVADELSKLVALRDSGVLTDAEFDQQKKRLLAAKGGTSPLREPPPTPMTPASAHSKRRRHRARWGILALVALIVIIVAIASSASTSKPPTHAAEVLAFNSFVRTIKSDLGVCTASASDIQIELGLLLDNSASVSQSNLVTLDTDSKNAQTACDEDDNNDVLNLGLMSLPGPLSSLQSLQNVPSEANSWATDDTTVVLHDVQNIAESNGGVVENESNLLAATTQADRDARALESQLSRAARQLEITSTPSIGLVTWTSNGSTTTTTPTGTSTIPPSGAPPTFSSSVPPALATALTTYFSNPSNSGVPISEVTFSATVDPHAPNWAEYDISGKPAYTSNVQGAFGLAEDVNGVWTIKSLGNAEPCAGTGAPASVASFFRCSGY